MIFFWIWKINAFRLILMVIAFITTYYLFYTTVNAFYFLRLPQGSNPIWHPNSFFFSLFHRRHTVIKRDSFSKWKKGENKWKNYWIRDEAWRRLPWLEFIIMQRYKDKSDPWTTRPAGLSVMSHQTHEPLRPAALSATSHQTHEPLDQLVCQQRLTRPMNH